ncbi:MAG: hypothetical protein ACRCWC_12530 [Plesiomonas shigelloides]
MTTHDFYQLLADTRVQAHLDANDTALDCADCRPTLQELADDYYYAHTEDYDAGYLTSEQLQDVAQAWAIVYHATALHIWARHDVEQAARGAD